MSDRPATKKSFGLARSQRNNHVNEHAKSDIFEQQNKMPRLKHTSQFLKNLEQNNDK